MKIKRTEKYVDERVFIDLECDKCGVEIEKGTYDAFMFNFTVREGDAYPSGGAYTDHNLDLCKDCANEAVVLLKDNGFKIYEENYDY